MWPWVTRLILGKNLVRVGPQGHGPLGGMMSVNIVKENSSARIFSILGGSLSVSLRWGVGRHFSEFCIPENMN